MPRSTRWCSNISWAADPVAPRRLTRRRLLSRSLRAAGGLALASPLASLLAGAGQRRFKIGACDWSLNATAHPRAFDVAREIGLDGVQVSLGTQADNLRLRQRQAQQECREAAQRTGLEIASLALGELNQVPFKSDPRTLEWVRDSIDTCRALERKVVLLAFFHHNDLKNDPAGTDETVRRLREVAPRAEKAGVTLGIESWLSAEEHLAILDRVGSPAVKVYYDVANAEKMGYDICSEIRWLGKKGLICEFHMKENGSLLGQGRVDFRKVRAAIEDIGYTGWLQIEGALPTGADLVTAYRANLSLLRTLFD